jgi:DNA-3-methyladenine glycosylase II
MPRPRLADVIADLSGRDPVVARLVALAGPIRFRPANPDGPFGALVRSITYQQLAGRAAEAIHGRFRALVDGPLTPEAVLALPVDAMRGAGLSAAKTASILDLAAKVADGTVVLTRTGRLSDDEIVERLVTVRGIGRWTAEMFLLFELRRLDVWPVDDLGVRTGYGLAWGLPEAPPPRALAPLGDRFRPYRSIVACYCWEAVHLHRSGIAVGGE